MGNNAYDEKAYFKGRDSFLPCFLVKRTQYQIHYYMNYHQRRQRIEQHSSKSLYLLGSGCRSLNGPHHYETAGPGMNGLVFSWGRVLSDKGVISGRNDAEKVVTFSIEWR